MLPGHISQKIQKLMDQYGPETVMKAAEIAAGDWRKEPGDQFQVAIQKVEQTLAIVRQVGQDESILWFALDELDRAVYVLRCTAHANNRKGMVV